MTVVPDARCAWIVGLCDEGVGTAAKEMRDQQEKKAGWSQRGCDVDDSTRDEREFPSVGGEEEVDGVIVELGFGA